MGLLWNPRWDWEIVLRLAEGRLAGGGERRPGSIHSVKPQQCAESSSLKRNLGTGKKGLPSKVHLTSWQYDGYIVVVQLST